MGFGLLFIGYFFLLFFPLSRIDVLPNLAVVGCIIMLAGLKRLTHYCADNRAFKIARVLCIVLSAVSIAALMLDVASIDGMLDGVNFLTPITNTVFALSTQAFTGALLVGAYKLAVQVELPKLAKRSVFVLSVNAAYLVAELTASVCSIIHALGVATEAFTLATGYIGIAAFILAYLVPFVNLVLIFSCYAHICLEGDEDMAYSEDIFDKIVAWTKRNKK